MDSLSKQFDELAADIVQTMQKLDIASMQKEQAQLQQQMQASDFWQDNQLAQIISKDAANLASRILPWQKLEQQLKELGEIIALHDTSLEEELVKQLNMLRNEFTQAKKVLRFSGPFDNHSAIVSIHAGAGGTDAQDWAQMLLRMYTRWAESNSYVVKSIEQASGDEAGIKSATFEVDGPFAFGKLRGEHGVHRLVRLSPFNADNLRQTSFTKVEVLPKIDKPDELIIDDKDLKIDVFRAGGHGGQSVNTTDSAVRITHTPTGITVSIQNERSQLQNKETAMTILRSRLAQLQLEQHQEKIDAIKGPNQSAEWGNQIRSYVLHPYKQVKDLRTRHESSDPSAVLDGALEPFIDSYLEHTLTR